MGGRVERSKEVGGRRREGEARAKPGNQLVIYTGLYPLRGIISVSDLYEI